MTGEMRHRLDRLGALCQFVEETLAHDPARGQETLAEVIREMESICCSQERFLPLLRPLKALNRGLCRTAAREGKALIAHKAVKSMWTTYFQLQRSLGFGLRTKARLFWSRLRLVHGVAILTVVMLLWGMPAWLKTDATSDIRYDLLSGNPPGVTLVGFHGVERDSSRSWRWIDGPMACLGFVMPKSRDVALKLTAMSPISGQNLRVLLNNTTVASYNNIPAGNWDNSIFKGEIVLRANKGDNILCLECTDYNHGETTFAPDDPSRYSMALTYFSMTAIQ